MPSRRANARARVAAGDAGTSAHGGGASKGHRLQASPREFKRQSAGTRKLKPKRSGCPLKAALPCALVPCVARPHTRARVSTPAQHLSVADASSACCLSLTPFPLAGLRCADGQRSRADQAPSSAGCTRRDHDHPASRSHIFPKVRAAWAHSSPHRHLPMSFCTHRPPLPARAAACTALWRALPCGHAALPCARLAS